MTAFIAIVILLFGLALNSSAQTMDSVSSTNIFTGTFKDDYDIRYTITDTMWIQQPNVRYHIIKWDKGAQYILAKNDQRNPSEQNLYTRIDYMQFNNMAPWEWGFCLTVYNANSAEVAMAAAAADRKNPRKGCNNFPFSRMQKLVK
jgi:hypothetical protein